MIPIKQTLSGTASQIGHMQNHITALADTIEAADTLFQQRWHEKDKLRPKFEVLHIGETFTNWAGRVQPRLDGKPVPQSSDNKGKFAAFMNARRINRFDDRYKGERL